MLLAELAALMAAAPAGAQEVKPPLTVDGPGPCRRIGGEWLQPGYCELTGPLRVAPDDTLVLAVGAFLLGPVEVEGGLEVRGAASLVFFFGDLANRGRMAVLDGGVTYVAGRAESPGAVELSGGGRMEILSDSGSLAVTGRLDVAPDGRLDVYGAFDNQGLTTNLGVLAVWCSGSQPGLAPQGQAAQVQDCHPPEVSLVSRTPADASGWNRGTVTVVWACSDGESGVLAERVTAVLSGDGAEQSAFGVCTDLAGNTAAGVVTGINIERPAPRIRRQPAPPVVVHIEPAAPAPAPPAPPSTAGPSTTGPLPAAPPPAAAPAAPPVVGPLLIPENGPLPGPAITDPVSSPDPAPGAPVPAATPSPGITAGSPAPAAPGASTSVSTPASPSTASASSTAAGPSSNGGSSIGGSSPASAPTSETPGTPAPPATAAPSVATGTTVWATTTASAPSAAPASPAASVGAAAGIAATTTTRSGAAAASPAAAAPVAPTGG